jgi:hypothetical protein
VLNKTSAYTGLVIVTAAGALLTSSPAYALDSLARGGSWSSNHHRSHHRNHNWNGNRHHGRIFIRIYIYNKNNNHAVAVARPEHRRHRRDFVPTDGVLGGVGAAGGLTAANQTPATSTPDTASTNQAPASTNQAPASTNQAPASTNEAPAAAPVNTGTPADQGTVGAPAASRVAPLDEGATGNVSP